MDGCTESGKKTAHLLVKDYFLLRQVLLQLTHLMAHSKISWILSWMWQEWRN